MTVMIAPEMLSAMDGIQWHRICRVDDLENCWGEAALVDGRQVALFRISETEVYAVDQRDPATGAYVMARGIVGNSGTRATIASPLHKQVYLLSTGECLGNPDLLLPVHPVRLEDGAVLVGLAGSGGGAGA
ncbi:nitrite reductase small subunit NirD [Arthrobacter sp. GCM10027362]|uniref:nitrite reductase small subunit NirD n=1 Tax=Arthrobacter sp. GCM10027362 TaxID=3273379 RepID=UPI00362F04DA